MKKIALLMLLICATSWVGFASTADMPSEWARPYVESAVQAGFVPEYLLDDFRADISRGAFAQLMVGFVEQITGYEIFSYHEGFEDADDIWVKKAASAEIINGIGGNRFAPEETITREEVAAMFVRAIDYIVLFNGDVFVNAFKPLAFEDADLIAPWAKSYVTVASNGELLIGFPNNTFQPKGQVTVEQAILVVERMNQYLGNTSYLNRVTENNRGYTAPFLEQALYLAENEMRLLTYDLFDLIGRDKHWVLKTYGRADDEIFDQVVGKERWDFHFLMMALYFEGDDILGFSVNTSVDNPAFKGTVKPYKNHYTLEEARQLLEGDWHFDGYIENGNVRVGYDVLAIGEGGDVYTELVWEAGTGTYLAFVYFDFPHRYVPYMD